MKCKLFLGICILILLVGTAAALDEGYPIIGRFIGDVDSARLEFGECKTADFVLENGELVFTIDESTDITDSDGASCVSKIDIGDRFKVVLNISGCGEKEYKFQLAESATYLGTYEIKECAASPEPSYQSDTSAGGGLDNNRIIVVRPEELDNIISENGEGQKAEEPSAALQVQAPEVKPAPTVLVSTLDPVLITLSLILVGCIIWLLVKLRHVSSK